MDLRNISTEQLVLELKAREKVRSMEIDKDESFRILANGNDGTKSRHMRGYGKAVVLEISV